MSGLMQKVARDVWPNGVVLVCKRCGYEVTATTEQAGRFLAHGWPEHCGQTISIKDKVPA